MTPPSMDDPFCLATLEDDTVTKLLSRLADELCGRADCDAFDCELADPWLLKELADDIRDHLQQAILKYRSPTSVVEGYRDRRRAA